MSTDSDDLLAGFSSEMIKMAKATVVREFFGQLKEVTDGIIELSGFDMEALEIEELFVVTVTELIEVMRRAEQRALTLVEEGEDDGSA